MSKPVTYGDGELQNRLRVEQHERWREIVRDIPWLSFPAGWQVQVLPPFAMATTRFMVRNEWGVEVSVYSDHYDRLGYVEEPYWEIMAIRGPLTLADNDEPERFLLHQVDEMLEAIGRFGNPTHAAKTLLSNEGNTK
jgi:hypothetical protein